MFRGSISSNAAMKDQQKDMVYDSGALVQPVQGPTWRGRFYIPSLNLDINISAHVSKNARSKVLEVASAMPASLHLEMIHRLDVWPASFESSPPTEHDAALLFFPERRDEDVLDNLLTHTINADFALKSMIGETELLIFTSLQLPQNFHRFYGKPYFWGVFRGQQIGPAASHVQNVKASQSLSLNSGNHSSPKGKGSGKTISSDNSSLSQASKADRRGRRLDIAWEHAKPLNASRQKAECNYCGFVSSHGGISRLKAHLGGGSPGISLPGCDKVPPDVRKVMVVWFGEWLKNTRALWTKEMKDSAGYVASEHAKSIDFSSESLPEGIPRDTHLSGDSKMLTEDQTKVLVSGWMRNLTTSKTKKSQGDGMRPETRGRRLDDAWKHANPLDPIRQKTQCKHCGFVSQYGGISRLKAHLGGGCPQMQLQGCPRVSLDVKRVMEQWFNEWAKNSSAAWIGKSHASPRPSKRKKPVDNTWEHATLLDEMGQATKCKYCGYISRFGGIARLKAHLAGGDPITQLEGCPNVPPEIKSSIAAIAKKKKHKGVSMEPTRSELQGTGRTSLMEAHKSEILQETLDEISNTSLKGRLKKLIEEKNDTLRKMHCEVQSLGRQLASIP